MGTPSRVPTNAWLVVEQTQKSNLRDPFLVTQPGHAALAGEIAANLKPQIFADKTADILGAVSLHDAGWGPHDAQVLQKLQAGGAAELRSFLDLAAAEFIPMWTRSIDVCAKISAVAGYIVSGHFSRLAHKSDRENPKERILREAFLNLEQARRQDLRLKQSLAPQTLERLVDVLQLCDLISLYLCCGSRQAAEFNFQEREYLVHWQDESHCRFTPAIFDGKEPRNLNIAALPYSRVKDRKGKPRRGGHIFPVSVL